MAQELNTHPECPDPRERALQIAHELCDNIKVREVGANRGYWVTRILASVGLGGGYSWCAAFVYFCLVMAGVPKSKLPNRNDGYNPAAVWGWYQWAIANGRFIHAPERGDLFFWLDRSGKEWKGHIGFNVLFAALTGKFTSLEGNTNDAGSRDGDGAYRKDSRSVKGMATHQVSGFISLGGLKS